MESGCFCDIELLQGERLDEIGFGDLKLIQNYKEFCYGIDAVLLSDFAATKQKNTKKYKKVMDLGTGTGIVPLILSHKTDAEKIFGLEVQKDSYERGLRNINLNKLQDRLFFINQDVNDLFGEELYDSFDLVTTNPPYTVGKSGITNSNFAKTIARHETTGTLEDFIRCASKLLRDKGDFFMVHRPSRLADICCLCREYKLEPKEMQFVSGKIGEKPNILLIHCIKNGGRELKILDPIYVYNGEKLYSEEILRIYEKIF